MDSPYEGYWFRLRVEWDNEYPFKPPKCTFEDKIWNPYIDFKTNQICLDILRDKFSPALQTQHIILSIISILSESKITANK